MDEPVGYLIGQVGELSGLRLAIPEAGLVIGRDPNQVVVVFDHSMVWRRHAPSAERTRTRPNNFVLTIYSTSPSLLA